MQADEAIEHQWPYIRTFFGDPAVVEDLAADTGALVRRREITSADVLLRLALIYGFCGYSLRQTAAWAESIDLVSVSDVALLKRFRASAEFMCRLVAHVLAAHVPAPAREPELQKIRLVDGTTIAKPGSVGADWRVHLGFDVRQQRISSLELTPASVGESLVRFTPTPGELLIADRGYARASGLRWVLGRSAHFLVRIPWNNLNFDTPDGHPFDLLGWLRGVPEAEPLEVEVHLRGMAARPLRLMALRKTEPATEKTRAKILRRASNHSKATDPRTLEVAAFTLLLTSKPAAELPAVAAFDLYRFRWQIELCFKKMKSIATLGHLPAKDPNLARMILASKLLGALLIEQLTDRYVSFSPWGYPVGPAPSLPLASG